MCDKKYIFIFILEINYLNTYFFLVQIFSEVN